MKKYVYIVQVTRQLSIDIINCFASQGHEVCLLTGTIESNYEPLHPEIKVTFYIKYNNLSNFGRVVTGVIFHLQVFFHLLFLGKKYELIFVTTPPSVIFLGLLFKKIRKQNYHLIIWDLYPDVLVNFKMLDKNSLITKIWKRRNKKCFDNASTIFTLGKYLSDAIQQYTTKQPIIISNWTNTDFIKPIDKRENPFALMHNLQDKLVVMYSGNMGITHNIEAIVLAAELLQDKTEICFVLIGDGTKKEKIKTMISEKKLTNILLLPYQNKTMLPYSMACSDIGIITLGQGAETVSVPSKTYYVLAAGSAILAIASPQSELGLLIGKYNCGKIFSGSSIKEIAFFIAEMKEKKEMLELYKKNSRAAAMFFTQENAKLYYNEITKN